MWKNIINKRYDVKYYVLLSTGVDAVVLVQLVSTKVDLSVLIMNAAKLIDELYLYGSIVNLIWTKMTKCNNLETTTVEK